MHGSGFIFCPCSRSSAIAGFMLAASSGSHAFLGKSRVLKPKGSIQAFGVTDTCPSDSEEGRGGQTCSLFTQHLRTIVSQQLAPTFRRPKKDKRRQWTRSNICFTRENIYNAQNKLRLLLFFCPCLILCDNVHLLYFKILIYPSYIYLYYNLQHIQFLNN